MNQTAAFWDRIAAKYASKPVPDEAIYQQKLTLCRQYLSPQSQVLEVGCGTGSTALALAPDTAHIRAIDFSSGMLEIARKKAAALGVSNVTFEQSDADQTGVAPSSVDTALAMSVLHLVDNRDRTITGLYDALKPGGICITSTACLSGRYRLLKPVLALGSMLGLLPRVRFFSIEELCASFLLAGFRVEKEWTPGSGPSTVLVLRKPRREST